MGNIEHTLEEAAELLDELAAMYIDLANLVARWRFAALVGWGLWLGSVAWELFS